MNGVHAGHGGQQRSDAKNGQDVEYDGRRLAVVIAILTADLISFTTILPLFPSILDYYSKKHSSLGEPDTLFDAFEAKARWLQHAVGVPQLQRYNGVFFGGVLGSLFSLLQYLSSPVFGSLSDTYGRRPLMIVAVAGSLISYTSWLFADSFTQFVVSRVVGGLSKASVSIAIAMVTDICPTRRRGHGMALVGASFSLAFIIGPVVGAYLATMARADDSDVGGARGEMAAKLAIILTVAELLAIVAFLPETTQAGQRHRPSSSDDKRISIRDYFFPKALFEFKALRGSLSTKDLSRLRRLGLIYFLYLFAFSALEFTLCFLTHVRFNYTSAQQGRLYLFIGILMVTVQGGYVRRIPISRQRTGALVGLTLIMPAFLLVGAAHATWLFYSGLALFAVASALVVPCLTTMMSALAGESTRGTCTGIFRGIGSLSRACGPIFGSLAFWLVGPIACYTAGAVFFAVPALLLYHCDDDDGVANSSALESMSGEKEGKTKVN